MEFKIEETDKSKKCIAKHLNTLYISNQKLLHSHKYHNLKKKNLLRHLLK